MYCACEGVAAHVCCQQYFTISVGVQGRVEGLKPTRDEAALKMGCLLNVGSSGLEKNIVQFVSCNGPK